MVTITIPTAISGISRAQNKRFYRSTRLTPPINLIDTGHKAIKYRKNGGGNKNEILITNLVVISRMKTSQPVSQKPL